MATKLFDVHNHAQRQWAQVHGDRTRITLPQTRCMCVMGTSPEDWAWVQSMVEQLSAPLSTATASMDHESHDSPPHLVPAFGVHPWRIERMLGDKDCAALHPVPASVVMTPPEIRAQLTTMSWYQRLAQLLDSHPHAIVGEIGLDKSARNRDTGSVYPFAAQTAVFRVQWELAIAKQRPVSIHCVKAGSYLLQFIQTLAKDWQRVKKLHRARPSSSSTAAALRAHANTLLPPKIMLHSYSGSPDILRQLFQLPVDIASRLYASFSEAVNRRSPQLPERIHAVPLDRLLIETDENSLDDIDQPMEAILHEVAKVRDLRPSELAPALFANACRFYF
ncbi:Cut9-interacting protein scn1 [Dimargaris verticillata]|uniref:Cut9-interacting protein scn1 n=1 Tax=Dimargaris verticillata TaxID=2761393 RepID=A0A9W8B7C6_9FUNG|nr:Cut9-interacting protein scn1 [Dimargaris verticillata]